MATEQTIIDAWFDRFLTTAGNEPFSFNFLSPEDRVRLVVSTTGEDGRSTVTPLISSDINHDELWEKRNEIYQMAQEGKLFLFPLGDMNNFYAVNTDDKKEPLTNLDPNSRLKEMPKQSDYELGFFKRIFNQLFGFFQDECDQLDDEYNRKIDEYNAALDSYEKETEDLSRIGNYAFTRQKQVQDTLEVQRSQSPAILKNLEEDLKNETLLSFQRRGLESQKKMITALKTNSPLEDSEAERYLTDAFINRLGTPKTATEEKGKLKRTDFQVFASQFPDAASDVLKDAIKESPTMKAIISGGRPTYMGNLFSMPLMDANIKTCLKEAYEARASYFKKDEAYLNGIEAAQVDPWVKNREMAQKYVIIALALDKPLTAEEAREAFTDLILGAILDPKIDKEQELVDIYKNNPEEFQKLRQQIKNSKTVSELIGTEPKLTAIHVANVGLRPANLEREAASFLEEHLSFSPAKKVSSPTSQITKELNLNHNETKVEINKSKLTK